MTPELYWLTLTALMTGLFWAPYILNRMAVRGPIVAMSTEAAEGAPHAPWAARAMVAHKNAVENLVIFATLVLAAHAAGVSTAATATAASVYFFARLVHFAGHTVGVPFVRTGAFLVGVGCQLVIALALLGLA